MVAGRNIFDGDSFRIVIDQAAVERLSQGKGVRVALERIGQIGEAAAKRHAPVDTGNLRRSITHELGKRGKTEFVRVGTNVEYAVFQELGTRHHPAHPFLRPAMEDIRRTLR